MGTGCGSEEKCRVRSFSRSAEGDHVFICPDQTGIGCHQGDLDRDLCSLTENPEGKGHDLVDLIGADPVPNATADPTEGVCAGENLYALCLKRLSVLIIHFLSVGLVESRHMRHGNDL